MAGEPHAILKPDFPDRPDAVEMPAPTIAPLTLSLGLALVAMGLITSVAFLVVGVVVLLVAISLWIVQIMSGRGHVHETLVEPARRPSPVAGVHGNVEQLITGMPGYRMRLPERVHPISAGVKGGAIGGLVMPLPALLYGVLSGHGIWYPINLLAGMVLPYVGEMTVSQLERFNPSLLLLAVFIHVVLSVVVGLLYGVVLPTLPPIPTALSWGGLLMPILWTAVTFSSMRVVNPILQHGVDWPWFIVCQFLFGVVAAVVVNQNRGSGPIVAGLLGGTIAGLLMPVPAVLWGWLTGRGIWYPVNLLAGMVLPGMVVLDVNELQQFHATWLIVGVTIHALMSIGFGLLYGVILPRLRPIPAALAWGGLVTPLLWTSLSYGLMGVVNPALQERVHWPWFVVSQFVFGVIVAVVVVRSEMVAIAPAGRGPDRAVDFLAGQGEARS
jgi:hypothetical protein